MRAYGTPHALIFPIYGWSLTHIERSFFAALLKERGRGQLTGCFRPFLTCAKRRACGFSAGPSTLMRKIGFLLSFCGGVFWCRLFSQRKGALGENRWFTPLRHYDSRPCSGRQSCRCLESGSLHPPQAALHRFPQFVRRWRTKNFQSFSAGHAPAENPLTRAPWAHTPVRRLVVGEVEGKQPKCRQRRKK